MSKTFDPDQGAQVFKTIKIDQVNYDAFKGFTVKGIIRLAAGHDAKIFKLFSAGLGALSG